MRILCAPGCLNPLSAKLLLEYNFKVGITMLPMGSIVTVCMFIGLIYALLQTYAQSLRRLPKFIHALVGGIVFAAGAWNVFWYAARNITQFWGIAALISGLALMLTGYVITRHGTVPTGLKRFLPIVLLILFACMMLYGKTIYRM